MKPKNSFYVTCINMHRCAIIKFSNSHANSKKIFSETKYLICKDNFNRNQIRPLKGSLYCRRFISCEQMS